MLPVVTRAVHDVVTHELGKGPSNKIEEVIDQMGRENPILHEHLKAIIHAVPPGIERSMMTFVAATMYKLLANQDEVDQMNRETKPQ